MRGAIVVTGVVLLALAPVALAEPATVQGRFALPAIATGSYASHGEGHLLVTGDAGQVSLLLDGATGTATRLVHRSFGYVSHDDPQAEVLWGQRTERMPLDLSGGLLTLESRRDGFQLLAQGAVDLAPQAAADVAIGGLTEDLLVSETLQRPLSVRLLDRHETFEATLAAGQFQERVGAGQATLRGPITLFVGEATARFVPAQGQAQDLALHLRTEERPGGLYNPVTQEWFGMGTHTEYVQESLVVEATGRLQVAFSGVPADVFAPRRTIDLDGTLALPAFHGTVAVAGDEPATHTLRGEALELAGRLSLTFTGPDAGQAHADGTGDVTMVRYGQVAASYPWATVAAVGLGAIALAIGAWLASHKALVGGATGGLIAGYARVQGEEILEHPGRAEVYERIKATPGIHVVQLAQQVAFGESTLTYHLRVLEKNGYVQSVRDGRYLRYFDRRSGTYAGPKKVAVSALRNTGTAAMARYLREHPGAPQRDIALAFGVTASTVTWHMNRLAAAGLVTKVRDGAHSRYYISEGWAALPAEEQQRQMAVVA